jgi:hypothetical protein
VGRDSETWLYCGACGRTMKREDSADGCVYDDCPSERNLAFQSLYGWDAYRLEHFEETVDWPEIPAPGECYRLPGAGP